MRASFAIAAVMLAAVPCRGEAADLPGLGGLVTGLPQAEATGRDLYVKQVMAEAVRQGVPPGLADAVAVIETGYNADARGTSGEVGLMQILPGTAAGLGFTGNTGDLFDPATNIHFGVAYLARAWAASGGNVCRALMKYRAGVGEEGFSPLSIQYCQRAHSWLASIDSPLAAGLAATTPASPTAADPYQIALSGQPIHHVSLTQMAALADMPDLVVQPMRAAAAGRVVQPMRAGFSRKPVQAEQSRAQIAVNAALSED